MAYTIKDLNAELKKAGIDVTQLPSMPAVIKIAGGKMLTLGGKALPIVFRVPRAATAKTLKLMAGSLLAVAAVAKIHGFAAVPVVMDAVAIGGKKKESLIVAYPVVATPVYDVVKKVLADFRKAAGVK